MKFYNISSGSKGNCTYIENGDEAIIVDMGISYKRLCDGLALNNLSLEKVKGVVVSHCHSDHTSGLAMLTKRTDIPVYVHPNCGIRNLNNLYQYEYKEPLKIGDFNINATSVDHDVYCLGFEITTKDRKITMATDLARVEGKMVEYIKDANLLYLEANYNEYMLRDCEKYPCCLKNRIRETHMENTESIRVVINKYLQDKSTEFVFAHLSENSNSMLTLEDDIKKTMSKERQLLDENKLHIAKQYSPLNIISI